MAKMHSGETIPMLREDGTVYFQRAAKTISERLCEWTLALLWSLVLAVIVSTLFWS